MPRKKIPLAAEEAAACLRSPPALTGRLCYPLATAAELIGATPDGINNAIKHRLLLSFILGNKRVVSHRALEAFVRRGEQVGHLDLGGLGRMPKNVREGGMVQLHARRTRPLRTRGAR